MLTLPLSLEELINAAQINIHVKADYSSGGDPSEDHDRAPDSGSVTYYVTTNQPPVVNSVTADPDELWPPNHKPVDVTITVNATDPNGDNVSANYSVADEYGIYDVPETALPSDGIISLIAERDGADKDGRVYTITVTVYDSYGLSDNGSVDVLVPHDRGKRGK
ncbi:MAG: hypothetical protein ACE5LA_05665 [Dehalococcoidales bacterium]